MTRHIRLSIEAELAQLDAQLLTLRQKEDNFQRIIDDLHKLKDDVTKDRKLTEAKLNVLELQRLPINWLPTELLVQIFLAAADSNDRQLTYTGYRQTLSISHTCMKWRNIAVSTPHLWAGLVHHGFRKAELSTMYLERSRSAPLKISFYSKPDTLPTDECVQTVAFLGICKKYFNRMESLSLHTSTAIAQTYLVHFLQDHHTHFPHLRSLKLAITTPNPTFYEASVLLQRDWNTIKKLKVNSTSEDLIIPSNPSRRLSHLALEQVPLFSLPVSLLSNLRSLELAYPPRKQRATSHYSRHFYHVKMSSLRAFLAFTPLLEELTLTNTVPDFSDMRLDLQPIALNHMTSIDWTYPTPGDVQRLLSVLHLPALAKLELWITEELHSTVYIEGAAQLPERYTRDVVSLPALRDVALQTTGDADLACRVLRKLHLPALERLELAHCPPSPSAPRTRRTRSRTLGPASDAPVDASTSENEDPRAPKLPRFPRLDSLLRDPRLLHLTHLTLAGYALLPSASYSSSDLERAPTASLLGYMPALTSLSLDGCLGANHLLACLGETVAVGERSDDAQPNVRAVRVCPRLAALSLWDCADAYSATLARVVRVRNVRGAADDDGDGDGDGDGGAHASAAPGPEAAGSGAGTEAAAEAVVVVAGEGRKIKPLRKQRQLQQQSATGPETGVPTASTVLTMEEASRPVRISFVRVVNCVLMAQDAVLALRDLGVVDVIWAGSGSS